MKLSTKIILPIILISALLILLNGCISTVPTDESPGFTPGTITGIIASPCCTTSDEAADGETTSPEYWCYYCQHTWDLQDGIEVVLTYGEDEIATTTTNDKGEFTFTDVSPGRNYVITAYCPDFADNRPLVKDVALELIEGGSFDTKTTDLVSTSLGLVVDFLVLYTELGPEDIILEGVIADKPLFPNFPKFKKLVYEVRRVLENCEVNMMTDDDLQDALCRASEEVGRETDPDLVIGCSPGYTPPPPPPPPNPCAGNTAPVINKVEYSDDGVNFTEIIEGTTIHVIKGKSYTVKADVSDDTIKDPLTFQAYLDGVGLGIYPYPGNGVVNIPLGDWELGTHEIKVEFYDGCTKTTWGPVTVIVHDECYNNVKPSLTMPADDAVDPGGSYSWGVTASDDGIKDPLSFTLVSVLPTPINNFSVDAISGEISWNPTCADIIDGDTTFTVTIEVTDGCEPVQGSFKVTLYSEPCEPCYNNTAPEVIVPDDSLGIFVAAGSTYEADIFMSDVDLIKDPLTYDISILPPVTNPLVITPITGGVHISWDTDCADIVNEENTDYTITVEAFDGCDPTIKSFTITLLAEPCVPCSLSLQVKEGGKLVEYLDGLHFSTTVPTVPGNITYITYDDIIVGTNASKLWFRICAPPDAVMQYNFYRGGSCPNKWDYDNGSLDTPPGWSPILDSKFNTQYYPDGYPKPSTDDLIICNTVDPAIPVNILMVKVTEGNLITIYTFNIFR